VSHSQDRAFGTSRPGSTFDHQWPQGCFLARLQRRRPEANLSRANFGLPILPAVSQPGFTWNAGVSRPRDRTYRTFASRTQAFDHHCGRLFPSPAFTGSAVW